MKRKLILRGIWIVLVSSIFILSLGSCSSNKNYLTKDTRNSYSKVRTQQPRWNSTTSLHTRYTMKKKKSKASAIKKVKHKAMPKTREYNPNKKD